NAHLTSNANSNNKPLSSKSIWSITKEQLAYYTSQFRGMQPHPGGVIHGPLAKEFFEKSRLPINELRKIWQLSDVSKDGCLSLEEFLTAMHLVVLRRNDIQLPEELPPELNPSHIRNKLQGTKDPPESGPRQPKSPVNFDFNHRDLLKGILASLHPFHVDE
ncbi:Putative LOC100161177, partial [Caligus rogercresseyi]